MKKVEVKLIFDKLNRYFFCINLYNKYVFKQYIINNDLIYTFFLVINFMHKYGFIKIK